MTNGRCDRPIARPAMVIVLLLGSSSLFESYSIAVAAQLEKRREPRRVRHPQQVELIGDRPVRIKPRIFRRAPAVVARRPAILRQRPATPYLRKRLIHQSELDR